jgi:hypothetical protein
MAVEGSAFTEVSKSTSHVSTMPAPAPDRGGPNSTTASEEAGRRPIAATRERRRTGNMGGYRPTSLDAKA